MSQDAEAKYELEELQRLITIKDSGYITNNVGSQRLRRSTSLRLPIFRTQCSARLPAVAGVDISFTIFFILTPGPFHNVWYTVYVYLSPLEQPMNEVGQPTKIHTHFHFHTHTHTHAHTRTHTATHKHQRIIPFRDAHTDKVINYRGFSVERRKNCECCGCVCVCVCLCVCVCVSVFLCWHGFVHIDILLNNKGLQAITGARERWSPSRAYPITMVPWII
jgi:hypothetical protein